MNLIVLNKSEFQSYFVGLLLKILSITDKYFLFNQNINLNKWEMKPIWE